MFLNPVMNDKHFPCLKTEITPSVCVAMFAAVNHNVIYVCTLFAAYSQDGVLYAIHHRARQIKFRYILSCWTSPPRVLNVMKIWESKPGTPWATPGL